MHIMITFCNLLIKSNGKQQYGGIPIKIIDSIIKWRHYIGVYLCVCVRRWQQLRSAYLPSTIYPAQINTQTQMNIFHRNHLHLFIHVSLLLLLPLLALIWCVFAFFPAKRNVYSVSVIVVNPFIIWCWACAREKHVEFIAYLVMVRPLLPCWISPFCVKMFGSICHQSLIISAMNVRQSARICMPLDVPVYLWMWQWRWQCWWWCDGSDGDPTNKSYTKNTYKEMGSGTARRHVSWSCVRAKVCEVCVCVYIFLPKNCAGSKRPPNIAFHR